MYFVLKFTAGIVVTMVSLLIIGIFLQTYQPRILKTYEDKRNYVLSVIDFFKNIRIIVKEHTDTKEYKNMLFENILKSEKPSVWNWFGRIFVHTHEHIINQEKINEQVKEKLKEHDDHIKEIFKKKDEELSYWKKRTFKLRKILAEYQKKFGINEDISKRFEDDESF